VDNNAGTNEARHPFRRFGSADSGAEVARVLAPFFYNRLTERFQTAAERCGGMAVTGRQAVGPSMNTDDKA